MCKKTPHGHIDRDDSPRQRGARSPPVVGHLTFLHLKLVDERLSIKEVMERFIPHLKKTWTHPEQAAPQPCWENTCMTDQTHTHGTQITSQHLDFFQSHLKMS